MIKAQKRANSDGNSNPVKLQQHLDEVRIGQRNTVWPDTLRNSRAVDEFLWRGSSKAPLVQRVGALIIGVAYLTCGAGLASILIDKQYYLPLIIVAALWIVAGKLLLNVVRK